MDSYDIVQQIGENTTTAVFRAIRKSDGLPVVIKLFHLNSMEPQHLRPFTIPYSSTTKNVPSEVVILEKVKQVPSCVQMLDNIDDSENGKWAVVLEDLYEQGYSNLAREIGESEVPMDEVVVSWIMRELINVLDQLHCLGVLHCDIKPDNIFVDYDKERIKLIDFNLALEVSSLPDNSTPGCTPEYAPPEVLIHRKPWTTAGEVWSLGCTAFVLLCRRFPFDNPWLSSCSSPAYPQCVPETSVRTHFGNNYHRITLLGNAFRTEAPLRRSSNGCLSPKSKDFLLSCLSRLPEQRASLRTLRQHSFLSLKAPSLCTVSNTIEISSSPRTVLVS